MLNIAKVFAACLIVTACVQRCSGSAIPIWEFLTRNEKMSYLYSTFAQLVSVHCKAAASTSSLPVNQCKHNLLGYGYEKLQTFSDQQLDAFDPYQRGASELIWSSIMRDHPSSQLITTRKPFSTPPASSIIILSHQPSSNKSPEQHRQQATSANTPAVVSVSDHDHDHNQHHQQPYGKNPMFETDAEHHHKYAMDMDVAYGYPVMAANPQVDTFNYKPQQHHQHPFIDSKMTIPQQPQEQQHFSPPHTYLTGPLVFRVRPDGSPVEEDQHKPLPRDDDLEEYHIRMATDRNTSNNKHNNNNHSSDEFGRQNKHHKVATISALKHQQQLATLAALQQQLQPPVQQQQQQRLRRHYQIPVNQQPHQSSVNDYFYSWRQA